MKVLRWVLLALYLILILILGLGAVPILDGEALPTNAILIGVLVFSQGLFILGAGTVRLCRPIRRGRLWMPVAVAALMLAILVAGLSLALGELLGVDMLDLHVPNVPSPWEMLPIDRSLNEEVEFWSLLGCSWVGWGVLLWFYVRRRPRMQVLSRLAGAIFAGSLLELLATVPSHIVVSRRPGCFVGVWTMLGITAGLCVMLFSFGPGIVVLFLRPRYRREQTGAGPDKQA